MDKIHNRELEAFEKIYHQYYSPLCNYASKIVNDDLIAEEIVQNLFIEFWTKKNNFDVQNIDSYLLRSVKYKCYDHFRKKTKYSSN